MPRVYDAIYCPTCGKPVEVIRPIMGMMIEIACEPCDTTHVILLHDRQTLPAER